MTAENDKMGTPQPPHEPSSTEANEPQEGTAGMKDWQLRTLNGIKTPGLRNLQGCVAVQRSPVLSWGWAPVLPLGLARAV